MVLGNTESGVFSVLKVYKLVNLLGGFKAVHPRHLNIHENKLVSPVNTSALFLESLFEFFNCYQSILCLLDDDTLKFMIYHLNDSHNIKLGVVNDHYLDFAVTIFSFVQITDSSLIYNLRHLLVGHLVHTPLDLCELAFVTADLGLGRVDIQTVVTALA